MKTVILALALAFSTSVSAQENWRSGNNQHPPKDERHFVMDRHAHDVIAPATQEEVKRIVKVLKKTSFDKDRLEIAKLCVSLRPVLFADLVKMAKAFSFDKERKDFLVYAYRFCPDRHNYDLLEDVFSFRSTFREMQEEIRKQRSTERK